MSYSHGIIPHVRGGGIVAQLIISEYIEGSGSYGKAIEVPPGGFSRAAPLRASGCERYSGQGGVALEARSFHVGTVLCDSAGTMMFCLAKYL